MNYITMIGSVLLITSNLACGKNTAFHFTPETNVFQQNQSQSAKQIDILWVIDNSGSMKSSQENVAASMDSFLDAFTKRNLDFQMAVTTSDAYRAEFLGDPQLSRLKDGNATDGASGYPVVNRATPMLKDVFLKNILQGIAGSGDERPLQSLRSTLQNPLNSDFYRPGAYLAVIILSDEDDFSHAGQTNAEADPSVLEDTKVTSDFLHAISSQNSLLPRFSVSAITIKDQRCLNKVKTKNSAHKVARRLGKIVKETNGISGSICGDFGKTLSEISGKILQLLNVFQLERRALESSIVVTVDGEAVKRSRSDGWSYDKKLNVILFHGAAIPGEGASVRIDYTPTEARKHKGNDGKDGKDSKADLGLESAPTTAASAAL